jgi:hypothetical protein
MLKNHNTKSFPLFERSKVSFLTSELREDDLSQEQSQVDWGIEDVGPESQFHQVPVFAIVLGYSHDGLRGVCQAL